MNKELLSRPFENILQRQGAGGKSFDYVKSGDVIQRVIEASSGEYEWEVLRFEYRDAMSVERVNKRTGETYTAVRSGYWIVHGRLTLPGLGSRDGIGTQVEENEDFAKGAETDAFKRAAVKFGVALDLYRSDDTTDGRRSTMDSPRAVHQPPVRRENGAGRDTARPNGASAVALNDNKASAAQVNAITTLCKKSGTDVSTVLSKHGVETLEQLPGVVAGEVIRALNAPVEARA